MVYCTRKTGFRIWLDFEVIPEIVNSMRLKSALEDFEKNTLGAVRGVLAKLSYVGRLHDGKGKYEHWGLARVYGEDAAQRALGASHREVLSEVLKKPLPALLHDVRTSCSDAELTEEEFLESLKQPLPKPLSSAARAHLKSVLSALSALVESRNNANLQGASQSPPPAPESRPPAGT